MKYLFGFIAGMILGGFSEKIWGVFLGAALGTIWAWVLGLSQKVKSLESKINLLQNQSSNQTREQSQWIDKQVSADEKPADSTVTPHDLDDGLVEDGLVEDDLADPTAIPTSVLAHKDIDDSKQPSAAITEVNTDAVETTDELIITPTAATHGDAAEQAANEWQGSTDPVSHVEPIPHEPSAFGLALNDGINKVKNWIVGYFTGGNSLVRTGMLVLFVGVAFLLKYVAERTVVPVEVRYVAVVAGSLLLLGLGWRLRQKRPGFALSLQGGAIGVLYLTLFAAMRLHQLLPSSVVLLCLIAIVVLSASLAILQNSMALAVIGVLGGFAAPILTSTGSGSHVQLFAYYLLLNLSIFGIAWFKSWRALNVIGFFATFAVGSIWGVKFYQPQFFATVEPFLVAHFLLYVIIAVLFAFKQPPKLKGINDGTLIFGTPIVVFSLQAALVKDMTYGLAYSALVLGVFYIFLAYLVKKLHRPFFKDMIESFIALGVGFATLAIPLGFDGRVTSAMWVAEASALVWVGIRQSRLLPRFSGYALAVLGSLAFFVEPAGSIEVLPFLNADFVGVLIIVAATAFMGLYARKHAARLVPLETPWVGRLMLLTAIGWWTLGGYVELAKHFPEQLYLLIQLWLMTTVLILLFWGQKLSYRLMITSALILNILMLPVLFDLTRFAPDAVMFWNIRFMAMLVVAVFYLLITSYWQKSEWLESEQRRQMVSRYFLLAGVLIWLLAMIMEINKFMLLKQLLWNEVVMAATAGMLLWHGHRKQYEDFKWVAVFVTILMVVPVYLTLGTHAWLMPNLVQDPAPIFNVTFMALLVYFVTHFLVGNYWQQHMLGSSANSLLVSRALLLLSLLSWVLNGMVEIDKFFNLPLWIPIALAFISASFVLFVWAAHRLHWQDLHRIKYGMTPLLLMLAVTIPNLQDFHEAYGLVAWLFAFMINYWILKIYDIDHFKLVRPYHVLSLWIMTYVVVYEFATLVDAQLGHNNIWYAASFTGMLWLISTAVYLLRNRLNWPLVIHKEAYYRWALPVMIWVLWLAALVLNANEPGELLGVPYLPVLNVIDILGLLIIGLAIKVHQNDENSLFIKDMRVKYTLLAGTGFLLLNASMLRCFHYWYGIDYQFNDLMSSFMVQTGFSILWAATAVTLMVMAARKHWRHVWLLGLGLMIVVVAKLFLVDMSASGSIERIVAFLTVGFLLSLVGYFSPLPPEIDRTDDKERISNEA